MPWWLYQAFSPGFLEGKRGAAAKNSYRSVLFLHALDSQSQCRYGFVVVALRIPVM
jgi:hypothetical protein